MLTNPSIINPFPGIRSFEEKDSHLFFGREKSISDLENKLLSNHFLSVTGSSGSGKSSLIRAGLIPKLAFTNGNISPDWKLLVFRPGNSPLLNLSEEIVSCFVQNSTDNDALDSINQIIVNNEDGIITALQYFDKDLKYKYLIYIDQFEEIFRYQSVDKELTDKKELSKFIKLLISAVSQKYSNIYLVISLRSDFLNECANFEGLTQLINQSHYLVPRMTREEKMNAIAGPIKQSGANVSQQLIDTILQETSDNPDFLPLMQHALMRTWDYWNSNKTSDESIDIIHYETIGTISQALSLHAEQIYHSLTNTKSRFICERIFKTLTYIGEDKRGIRNPTQLHELCKLSNSDKKEVIAVIDEFRASGRAFLMPSDDVVLNDESIIDISHESIMRVWDRLKNWANDEAKSAQLYLRLSKSAELYEMQKAGVLVNPELQIAMKWLSEDKPNATWAMRYDSAFERVINFLKYSEKQALLKVERKENKQKSNLRRARFTAYILGGASIISIFLLVIALNLRFKAENSEKQALEKEKFAREKSKIADEQKKEAVTQKKIAEQQQIIANQQKIIAEEQKQNAIYQQEIAMRERKFAEQARDTAEEARKIAELAKDRALKAENNAKRQRDTAIILKDQAQTARARTDTLRRLSIAKSLAVQASKLQQRISKEGSKMNDYDKNLPKVLAYNAFLFNKNYKGNINDPDIFNALIEVSADKIILRNVDAHQDAVRDAQFLNDKKVVSVSSDGVLCLWELGSKDKNPEPLIFKSKNKSITGYRCLSISPDGTYICTGSENGFLSLWRTDNPKEEVKSILVSNQIVNSIEFIDNSTIIFTSIDGYVKKWNVTEPNKMPEMIQTNILEKNMTVTVNANRDLLSIVSENGKALIFKIPEMVNIGNLTLKNGNIKSCALSNNGWLATGTSTGIINLYNTNNTSQMKEFFAHLSSITHLSFSPNNISLASVSFDKTVKIWAYNLLNNDPLTISSHDGWVYSVEYSASSEKIVTASADKSCHIYTVNPSVVATNLRTQVSHNMKQEDWTKFVGPGIDYYEILP